MDSTNVRVIPTQANRIRALKAASPWLTDAQIAWQLNTHPNLVRLALEKGDKVRTKSVAP